MSVLKAYDLWLSFFLNCSFYQHYSGSLSPSVVSHSTFSTHTTADNTYNTLPAPTNTPSAHNNTTFNTTSNTTPQEPSLESENLLLQRAATAEQSSDHPLSRAVLQAAKERHLALHPLREDATVYFIGQCCVCMCCVCMCCVCMYSLLH